MDHICLIHRKKIFFFRKTQFIRNAKFPPENVFPRKHIFCPKNTFLYIFYPKHLFLLENFSAKDAIFAAGKSEEGCGLAYYDYESAYDFLSLDCVRLVLLKKGVCEEAVNRFMRLYSLGITHRPSTLYLLLTTLQKRKKLMSVYH